MRKHLKDQCLITCEGYIIEKPEEYRRNKRLLDEHNQSTPAKKKGGKKPKNNASGKPVCQDETVDKDEHQNFIDNVQCAYDQTQGADGDKKAQDNECEEVGDIE